MPKSLKAAAAASLVVSAALVGVARAESVTYMIDPSHTNTNFEVLHYSTATYRGRFDKKAGSVTIDTAARTGSADITIEVASISTGFAPLDSRLKTADFFDAATFPTIKFVGDKFEFAGSKVTSVAGSLTLRGQTHPVTLKGTNFNCYDSPLFKREVCGGDFEATISRKEYGFTGAAASVPDNVKLLIQIEAIKQ